MQKVLLFVLLITIAGTGYAEDDPWFENVPVIGELPPGVASQKLMTAGLYEEAVATLEEADLLMKPAKLATTQVSDWYSEHQLSGREKRKRDIWKSTTHSFGYIAADSKPQLTIQHAGAVKPDPTLRNKQIKITIDALRIADYPGKGRHEVLFSFYAKHQTSNTEEPLTYALTTEAEEGERVGIIGYPIFIGLNVGTEGCVFKCLTTNVQNSEDKKFLAILKSRPVEEGLKLLNIAQPAVKPLVSIASSIAQLVSNRNDNIAVQKFYMGLDFSSVPTRARLREGSYIAVQIPEAEEAHWSWNDWVYDTSQGKIVSRQDDKKLVPYNYVVFGVSQYEEVTTK